VTRVDAHRRVHGALGVLLSVGVAVALIAGVGPAQSAATGPALTIGQGVDAETLDPHGSLTQATLNITQQINEPFLDWDYTKGEIKPVLATSWKQLNATTWQFKIRENVKFTNGEPLTAQTVKFNIDRLLNPANKLNVAALLNQLAGADVVDASTVNIRTTAPFPLLPLALTRLQLLPSEYFQKVGAQQFIDHPIGTGPYTFVSWVKDDRIILQANPDYWGGRPQIGTVVYRAIPNDASRMAALESGGADLVTNVNLNDVAGLKQNPDVVVIAGPSLRLMGIYLDSRSTSPFADKRIRQALNYAVDKKTIVSRLLLGYGKALPGQVLSTEYLGFNPAVQAYPYDPARAKQLLQEAGYKGGQLTLEVGRGRYPKGEELAQVVANQLQQVGVNATVQIVEWAPFIQQLMSRTLAPLNVLAYSTQPDAYFQLQLYMCQYRASLYCNAGFDALVQKALATDNPDARLKLYQTASALLHDDPPIIYLYQMDNIWAVRKRVHGWHPRPDEGIQLLGVTAGQ